MIDLLSLAQLERPINILCLGAHSDDIEIGCGGTLLKLLTTPLLIQIDWCVLAGDSARRAEAEASARDYLRDFEIPSVHLLDFEDSYFPLQARAIKEWMLRRREVFRPDIIFTHNRFDAHQDHRTVQELTWNVFRDQLILEYEIPKWDGDLGQPNTYVALPSATLERKIDLLMKHFGTQRSKDWFDEETFRGIARLRGMECRADEGYAEGFYAPKLRIF